MASPESTTLRIRRKTNAEGYPTYSVQKEQKVESDGRQRSKDNQSVGSLQPVEKAAVRDVRTSHSRTDSRRSHQRSAKPLRSRSSKRKRQKEKSETEQKHEEVREDSRGSRHRNSRHRSTKRTTRQETPRRLSRSRKNKDRSRSYASRHSELPRREYSERVSRGHSRGRRHSISRLTPSRERGVGR